LLAYELIAPRPTRRGNLRVVVERAGAVKLQRNDDEPPPGEPWIRRYPETRSLLPNAEVSLFRVLERGGFFSMEPLLVSEAASDGARRSLTWNGKRGPKTVTVDKARSADFDALIGGLFQALGLDDVD
jgi:hypothetical protein